MRVLNFLPNVGGIKQLYALMQSYARMESQPAPGADVATLDESLRSRLHYIMFDIQSLRTPDFMWDQFRRTGFFEGACSDMATLAASMLYQNPNVVSMSFVFARFPGQQFAWHVYLLATDELGRAWRIDPTAPTDADYRTAEILTFPVR